MTSGPPSAQDQDALIAELVGLTGLSTTEVSSTECHGTLELLTNGSTTGRTTSHLGQRRSLNRSSTIL
jgi:hypothetical protein